MKLYAMKPYLAWAVPAGLVFVAAAANAQVLTPQVLTPQVLTPQALTPQVLTPYEVVPVTRASDVGGPYAAMPPEGSPALAPAYGPRLLPPLEVYTIVRESGFSPLGIPQQRGLVYTISVINTAGDDGKLVVDARSGRIIRFMPAYRMGDNFNDDLNVAYGPVGPLPPVNSNYRRAPRPPLPVPHVASRSATPKAPPAAAKPAAPPPQQSAATAKPAEAPASSPSATVGVAKPSVQLQPTQEMPKAQGLD
jgi:hypothetical protein